METSMLIASIRFLDKHHVAIKFAVYCILFISIVYVDYHQKGNPPILEYMLNNLIDKTIFLSFILTFILSELFDLLLNYIHKCNEDTLKLATSQVSVNAIMQLYPADYEDFVTYGNHSLLPGILVSKHINNVQIIKNDLRIKSLHIIDCDKQYTPPTYILNNANEIFNIHRHSIIFNNIVIRIDDAQLESNGQIYLKTSRTTYYDSLLTNRAMDYKLPNNLTIRQIYEPGPHLSSLQTSKLSNHLGFNLFILTSDNKILFVRRSTDVSVSKATIGPSVAASLKTKYALIHGKFTVDGLIYGIQKEIEDELGITPDIDSNFRITENTPIIALYRDIIEGGKPQFVFMIHSSRDSKDISDIFYRHITAIQTKKKKEQDKVIIDGKQIVYIPVKYIISHFAKNTKNENNDSISQQFIIKTPDGNYNMSYAHATALALCWQWYSNHTKQK